MAICAFG